MRWWCRGGEGDIGWTSDEVPVTVEYGHSQKKTRRTNPQVCINEGLPAISTPPPSFTSILLS